MCKQLCNGCYRKFDESQMADWTICIGCKKKQMEDYLDEEVYIDALGIGWTKDEIEEAGGIVEVRRMVEEADCRGKYI
jgi:hypothetical protein